MDGSETTGKQSAKAPDPQADDDAWEAIDAFGGKNRPRFRPAWRDLFHAIATITGILIYIRYFLA